MGEPLSAAELFNSRAQSYLDKYQDISAYHSMLNSFLAHIPQQGNVLDLACGPGIQAAYLLSIREDLNYFGIDLAPQMITLAKQLNPKATFECLDAQKLDTAYNYEAIIISFLFPYLNGKECLQLLISLKSKLANITYIYLSLITKEKDDSAFVSPSDDDSIGIYMYFHSKEKVKEWVSILGWEIIKKQDHLNENGDQELLLLIKAKS